MTKKEKKGDESGVSLKIVSHDLYSYCHNRNGPGSQKQENTPDCHKQVAS